MFFELKEIELRNYLPNEVDLHGINTDQLSIMGLYLYHGDLLHYGNTCVILLPVAQKTWI